jgi:hypothetical protein
LAAALAAYFGCLLPLNAAQNQDPVNTSSTESTGTAPDERHEMYLSWGYHAESYRQVELRLSQPSAGNNFTLHNVDFHDNKGWDKGLFSHSLTGPQYNFQIGYFFRKNTSFEVNFVHAKAILTQNQTVRMTGTLNSQPVDKNVTLSEDVLKFQLNNGANFALFNIVQRFPLLRKPGQTGNISVLAKAGMGFVVPHVDNTVFGEDNDEGFEFSGPDMGLELAVRLHVYRALFLELCEKGVYARYRNLSINQGRADQELWARVTSLSFGASFKVGKKK